MKYYKIIFCIFVLVALIVPLSRMNTAVITEQENRTLAKFPTIKKKGKINSNYGKQFESWLGDRFWGRDKLINTRFQALYKINGRIENEEAFIGDDGWMFEKDKFILGETLEQKKSRLNSINTLRRFYDRFKNTNVQIYVIVPPARNQITEKFWRNYYPQKIKWNKEDEIIKAFKNKKNIHIVKVFKDIKEMNEKFPIYWKGDTHLNTSGQNIFHKNLLSEIKSLVSEKQLNRISVSETIKEHLIKNRNLNISAKLGLPAKQDLKVTLITTRINIKNTNYKELENKVFKNLNTAEENSVFKVGKTDNALINDNVIFIGGCYITYLFEQIKNIFSSSTHIRTNLKSSFPEKVYNYVLDRIKDIFQMKSGYIIIIYDELVTEPMLKEALDEKGS